MNNKLWCICTMDKVQPMKEMYLSEKISKKLLSEKTNELPSRKSKQEIYKYILQVWKIKYAVNS